MAPLVSFNNVGLYLFLCLLVLKFVTAGEQQPNSTGYFIHAQSPIYTFTGTKGEILPRDRNQHNTILEVPVVFGTRIYYSFIITKDGFVAFTNDSLAATYHGKDWSSDNIPPHMDIPFIAPYYHSTQEIEQDTPGHIFFQDLNQTNGHSDDLINLGRYIRGDVVGSDGFDPSLAIVVTWNNVTSQNDILQGICTGNGVPSGTPCKTNTFQLVLVTDGSSSYAIFNYGNLKPHQDKFDQAGFNGGDGIGWYGVLPQGTSLSQLVRYKASDQAGRYIFKISDGQIVPGGCISEPNIKSLSVSPRYADMFGGQMIDISGPCFNTNQQIKCSFGKPGEVGSQPSSDGIYVSSSRVRCMVPRLIVRDRITLSLSVNGGITYPYTTQFIIVLPGRMPSKQHLNLIFSATNWGWYGINSDSLDVSWNSMLLSNNSADRVEINVIGYREADGKSIYKTLATLGSNIPVQQERFSAMPQEHRCNGDDCYNFEQGLVEVRLMGGSIPQQYGYLSSKVIPLGWFVEDAMQQMYGTGWPTDKCVEWHNKDKQSTDWVKAQPACPCSLSQAIADFGRWQHDASCNLRNKKSTNCFYHQGAAHCVRAVQPVMGAGNQCCYTAEGTLMFAADSFQGSTPDRGHDWGAAPYGRPGYVPSLSHWLEDVVSFYYCCLWTENKDCDYYMDLRPTRDCVDYQPPVLASVFGQGHVTTFAGLKYRLRGPGDYILLTAGSTVVQGRFEPNPFPTEGGQKIETSYTLTAVSVVDKGTSDNVELSLSPEAVDRDRKRIDVWVNRKLVNFVPQALKWHDFTGVAVVDTDYNNNRQSNFTVMLTNGIGFQVAEQAGTLQMDLMLPVNVFTNVSGLFGDLDGSIKNRNGTAFDTDTIMTNSSDLYNNLQLEWAVREKSSSLLKVYKPANDSRTFGHFTIDPTLQPLTSQARSICGRNTECLFDYRVTGSLMLARKSKQAAERQTSLVQNLIQVRSCGLLDVPRSIKSSGDYVLGTTTTITGCRAGSLTGTTTYTCEATSNTTQVWSPSVDASCFADESPEDAGIGLIVGVTVAIVVLLAVAITVAVFAVKRRRSKEKKRTGKEIHEEEMQEMTKADNH